VARVSKQKVHFEKKSLCYKICFDIRPFLILNRLNKAADQ